MKKIKTQRSNNDIMYSKIDKVLKKMSDDEIQKLTIACHEVKKLDYIDISNLNFLITKIKKIKNLELRSLITNIIHKYTAPFSDNINKRDNYIIFCAIESEIIRRFYHNLKVKK